MDDLVVVLSAEKEAVTFSRSVLSCFLQKSTLGMEVNFYSTTSSDCPVLQYPTVSTETFVFLKHAAQRCLTVKDFPSNLTRFFKDLDYLNCCLTHELLEPWFRHFFFVADGQECTVPLTEGFALKVLSALSSPYVVRVVAHALVKSHCLRHAARTGFSEITFYFSSLCKGEEEDLSLLMINTGLFCSLVRRLYGVTATFHEKGTRQKQVQDCLCHVDIDAEASEIDTVQLPDSLYVASYKDGYFYLNTGCEKPVEYFKEVDGSTYFYLRIYKDSVCCYFIDRQRRGLQEEEEPVYLGFNILVDKTFVFEGFSFISSGTWRFTVQEKESQELFAGQRLEVASVSIVSSPQPRVCTKDLTNKDSTDDLPSVTISWGGKEV